MARLNVYVPDELAGRARSANVNVSAVVQAALADELDRRATNAWLDELPPLRGTRSHEAVIEALDEARESFGEPS
ncbi:type II toxin-antitoxin system CcdA family antitoxin [Mycolicibacterium pulveris]|uniref:type II toxin-antitoxin system CcdA family antitoxin n=1 Tax=Mycolicibacterium pulveris TaxID=36813 RepID=UPI003CED8360